MAKLTRVIALDCEMVSGSPFEPDSDWNELTQDLFHENMNEGCFNDEDMVARVSLVNKDLECVMDTFVKPTRTVVDYRTHVSGVREADLVNGEHIKEVRRKVKKILKGRILVGHGVQHDLEVLSLRHPKRDIRDTSEYQPFIRMNNYRTPALRWLAQKYLGITIQDGEHSSVEDARAVMGVYKKVAARWKKSLRQRKHSSSSSYSSPAPSYSSSSSSF